MDCNSTPIQTIHRPLQWGVSLIELMISVAILGVIAYIAIPIYNNYVDRTKIAEALTVVESAKNAMVEHHGLNGSFPESNKEAGLQKPKLIKGDYVKTVSIKKVKFGSDGKVPAIVLTLKKNPDRWGNKAQLIWRPNSESSSFTWTCCWRGFKKDGAPLSKNDDTPPYIIKFCPEHKNVRKCQ